VQIDTRSTVFALTNAGGNVTTASITFPLPATSSPVGVGVASGDGVIPLGAGGSLAPNGLQIVPFGAGSSTNTFSMNVYGWREVRGPAVAVGTVNLYVAYVLATFTCTLCTVPGLANTPVNASQLFCGTIALVAGNANISNEVVSPTGNTVAHVIVDVKGSKWVEVRFGTGSSATSCNALYAPL
jgi:hypothetical protein